MNALTSRALVAWIDKKLHEAGVEKVVPDEETLHDAYRECLVRDFVAARMQEIEAAARAHAQRVDPPADLEAQIRRLFDEDPAQPWDLAVSRLAAGRPSS